MALLAPNEGELQMLRFITGNEVFEAGDTLRLKLYDNNVSPAEGDTFSTYTESSSTGYGDTILVGDSWTIEKSGGGDTVSAACEQKTFTYTAGDTLYGYYITSKDDTGDTIVLWAEEFTDGPYTIPGGGGTVKVTPRIELE